MTTRIHDNVLKGIFLIVLFAILILQTLVADAQTYRGENQNMGCSDLSCKSSNTSFSNTSINNQTQVILGVSFGAHR